MGIRKGGKGAVRLPKILVLTLIFIGALPANVQLRKTMLLT